jgi:hypothetical protein
MKRARRALEECDLVVVVPTGPAAVIERPRDHRADDGRERLIVANKGDLAAA